jgi:ribosomal protein L11 methylase PrmA
MQTRFADKPVAAGGRRMSQAALRGLVDALRAAVTRLAWQPRGTVWADYGVHTSYTPEAADEKARLVARFVEAVSPGTVWDLGANVGTYSRVASGRGISTIAFDIDPAAVEKNYLECRRQGESNLLPLILDLANPSGGIGWANEERQSLAARGPADLALALALIHHLAIGNNVPFALVAEFLSRIARALVIEFVPKDDPQVQRLLASREDIFADYTQQAFERDFGAYFAIESSLPIPGSLRSLYLMRRRNA